MQTIQNTQANIKNTITMSLSQLNSQIMKANSKLFVEFARNFGEDLLGDLMNVMRQLHNENQNKTERPSVEESFELMQEHFQEVLDSRIEHMNNEVPRSVRGRKPKAKTIVAVDDTDDEGEKRGRPKKEEAKLEQTSLDSEQQQVLANAKKETAKPKKATTAPKKKSKGKGPKRFRRVERTVVKKNGKEKREKVWRKHDYELKDGEVFLNTWAVSEKTPNAKTPTFDNEADALKVFNGEQVAQPTMTTIIDIPAQQKKTSSSSSKKKVVEEVLVEVVQKPVEELKAEPYEEEDNGVKTDGDEGIDGIENDEETTVEVKTTTEENDEDDKIDIQKTFNPTEPYAPFTGVDEMVGKLIRFTDKTSVNYGKIINKETLQVFGWVDPNDEEQYVEEQPDYVEEEENDEDVIDCDWDF